jgi:hypothetical protein
MFLLIYPTREEKEILGVVLYNSLLMKTFE